jgi:cytoskeleton protein RodZ
VASFGVRLKTEREQRGITLEEISSSTKIGTRMLVALEQDHFDQLPGGIFNKGFIRAYARCLGLDEDQAIADYLVASGNVPAEKDKKSDGGTESSLELQAEAGFRESNLPWGTLAILLLLLALGLAGWGFYSREAKRNLRKPVAPAQSSVPISTPPPSLGPATATIPAGTPILTTRPSETKATSALEVPKPLTLHISLHSDSWLFITADGREILQGSFTAPTDKFVRAAKEIVVKTGNVAALDLEFNGKKVPAEGANGEVKTLTFDAAGLRPSSPPPATQ